MMPGQHSGTNGPTSWRLLVIHLAVTSLQAVFRQVLLLIMILILLDDNSYAARILKQFFDFYGTIELQVADQVGFTQFQQADARWHDEWCFTAQLMSHPHAMLVKNQVIDLE